MIVTNETNNYLVKPLNDLMGAVGKIGQWQVETISSLLNSVASAAEPIGKSASDLAGNFTNTVTQALQNISASLDSRK